MDDNRQNENDGDPATGRAVKLRRPVTFNQAAKSEQEQSAAEVSETMRRLAEERRIVAERLANTGQLIKALKEYGKAEAIRELLTKDIDLNWRDEAGNGLLHLAVAAGHLEGLALLVRAGADMHMKNDDGVTPLMVACAAYSRGDAAVLLAAADPDLSVHVLEGAHVLHLAALKYDLTRAVEVMLMRGVSPVIEDAEGRTPLYYAIASKRDCAVVICMAGGFREKDREKLREAMAVKELYGNDWDWELLIDKAAAFAPDALEKAFPKTGAVLPPEPDDVSQTIFAEVQQGSSSFRLEKYWGNDDAVGRRDHDGRTPLMAGMDRVGCDLWAVRTIAWQGDAAATDNGGRTALHYAAAHVSPADSIVDALLGRRAKVNAQDIFGRTALTVTMDGCNHISRLMEWGANPFLKDLLGLTAYDVAKIRKSDYGMEVLAEEAEKHGWNVEMLTGKPEKPPNGPAKPTGAPAP